MFILELHNVIYVQVLIQLFFVVAAFSSSILSNLEFLINQYFLDLILHSFDTCNLHWDHLQSVTLD